MRWLAMLTCFSLWALAPSAPAGATSVTTVAAVEGIGGLGAYDNDTSGGAPVTSSQVYSDAMSSGTAIVTTGVGSAVGHVYTTITASDGAAGRSYAAALGSWTDIFTISNPALTGQAGSFTFNILLDVQALTYVALTGNVGGGPSVCGSGCAVSGLTFDLQYDGQVVAHGTVIDSEDNFYDSITGDPAYGIYSFSVPFVFGFAQSMTVQLTVDATALVAALPGPGTATAAADGNFLSTLQWLGIAEVLDANGTPVAYSVSSDSGTDWSQAVAVVPEPGTASLIAVALVALARTRRQR